MEGWQGWDAYAAFYDWENARTVGRRDVAFWRALASRTGGRVLELGCGTGRVTAPLARAGIHVVGIDRSAEMLFHARRRLRRSSRGVQAQLVRGDIRQLPFETHGGFRLVLAPYGILQSLLRDRDLTATLDAVARVLPAGGRFGVDLVPDVPRWKQYTRRVTLVGRRGRKGPLITLVESVRQDRANRLTIFDHEYIVGWGGTRDVHRFSVRFRTLSVPAMVRRIEKAGFVVDALLGGYDGAPFAEDAGTWLILATRRG